MFTTSRDQLSALLAQALRQRKDLALDSNAFRWCNGAGDQLEHLVIDVFAQHIQITLYHPKWEPYLDLLAQVLTSLLPVDFMVAKGRFSPDGKLLADAPWQVLRGVAEQSRTIVYEGAAQFEVDLLDTVNAGLFLDMRAQRLALAVRINPGDLMLNLFSYTGSFAVQGRLAGARQVVNVDISAKIHQRAQRNYALNGIKANPGEFFRGDAREYMAWAQRKGLRFQQIVLDPPTFSRHKTGVFRVQDELVGLIAQGIKILDVPGEFLISTNCNSLSNKELRDVVSSCLSSGWGPQYSLTEWGQDRDFVGSGAETNSHLACVRLQFLGKR